MIFGECYELTYNFKLNNKTDLDSLWREIGAQYVTISQVLEELIDNSISNYLNNKKYYKDNNMDMNIDILICKQNDDDDKNSTYEVHVLDNGTGIQSISNAFNLGHEYSDDKSLSNMFGMSSLDGHYIKDSSLNEHGYGFKAALAAANPENDNWSIITKSIDDTRYVKIDSPFTFNNQKFNLINADSVLNDFNHGTEIVFGVEFGKMKNVSNGVKGQHNSMKTIIPLIAEDIEHTYDEILDDDNLSINLIYSEQRYLEYISRRDEKKMQHIKLRKLPKDNHKVLKKEYNEKLDNGARLKIKIIKAADGDTTNKKYYRDSPSCSGVEIRINGRLISFKHISDIFELKDHSSQNGLVIISNIISDDNNLLPKTTTTKTGIVNGDKTYDLIKQAIVSYVGSIKELITEDKKDEKAMFEDAYKTIKDKVSYAKNECPVFKTINGNAKADLYIFDKNNGVVFEGKTKKPKAQEVYQLKMYWDGLTYDKKRVDKGYLVTDDTNQSINELIDITNKSTDILGKSYYRLEIISWKEFRKIIKENYSL